MKSRPTPDQIVSALVNSAVPMKFQSDAATRDRLTVVVQSYHQHSGRQPTQDTSSVSRILETREPAYRRPMTVGESPEPIDLGWLRGKPLSLLSIRNVTGSALRVNPSPQERQRIDAAVVVLERAGGEKVALVRPGMFFFGEVPDPESLTIRCESGEAELDLIAYPA